MVHNEDLGDYNNDTIEPMSNMFISRHLKWFLPVEVLEDAEMESSQCLLYFNKNYTVALRRRIERKIKNNADFENSQMVITMNMTDGQKSAVVKDQLTELYKQFLSDYAHNMMTEYVTNINDDSIKFSQNITVTYDNNHEYPIYGRFVNSGLIVILAFFFHGGIAVRLQQVTGENCYYDGRTSYLARLAVQVPIAIVWNAFMVVHVHFLYDIISPHLYYVFLGLLLVSVCGIHLGNKLDYNLLLRYNRSCTFVKTFDLGNFVVKL
ncbi:uncharacterized protein LOC115034086 [Acyrthosiphon pisum]|uniref:Uncharacterized protein n=1 Tax=Acyrthosiphon pisum TaxID=7029 RepID=A0A8R2NTJ9_ACYPI|nr:uncharacterized protein LOC115034086 [Acyrthosiphon pisum]